MKIWPENRNSCRHCDIILLLNQRKWITGVERHLGSIKLSFTEKDASKIAIDFCHLSFWSHLGKALQRLGLRSESLFLIIKGSFITLSHTLVSRKKQFCKSHQIVTKYPSSNYHTYTQLFSLGDKVQKKAQTALLYHNFISINDSIGQTRVHCCLLLYCYSRSFNSKATVVLILFDCTAKTCKIRFHK